MAGLGRARAPGHRVGADVLPVRFSAVELAGVLALPTLPAGVRVVLDGGGA